MFRQSTPALDESALKIEFNTLPFLLDSVSTSLGYKSSLISPGVSDLIADGDFEPVFKRNKGVPHLRELFKGFISNFGRIHLSNPPQAGKIFFVIIFRGIIKKEDLDTVPLCTAVLLHQPPNVVFRLEWPEDGEQPLLFEVEHASGDASKDFVAFPECFTLDIEQCDNLIFLTPTGVERYLSDEDFDQERPEDSDIADEDTNGDSSPTSATTTRVVVPVHRTPSFTSSPAFEFGLPTALSRSTQPACIHVDSVPTCTRGNSPCARG